jgi:hypothetical protein
MVAFLRIKGQILWDVTVDTGYVQPVNFLAPGSRDMFDANNKVFDYLFHALCQHEFDRVYTKSLACRICSVLRKVMLETPKFWLGCMRHTGESTRTSLISLVSPSMPCFRGSRLLWMCSHVMIMIELSSSYTRWIVQFGRKVRGHCGVGEVRHSDGERAILEAQVG